MDDVDDAQVTVRERAKVLGVELEGPGGERPGIGDAVTIHGRVSAVHEDGTVVVTPEAVVSYGR